jgi:predicted permease
MTRRDLNDILKRGPGRGNSSNDHRVRGLLIVSEVALALMLLVGAGLLMRSLAGLRSVDPGFDPGRLLTASIDIPATRYGTPESRLQFFDRMLAAVRALPGVESAATVDSVPLRGGSSVPVAVEGAPPRPASELPAAAARMASPRYFATARIPLVSGRDFDERDTPERPLVAIVSELAAARFWPGENPIGKRLALTLFSMQPREVVGIVRDVKIQQLDEPDPEPAVYLPAAQLAPNSMILVVRTAAEPEALTRTVGAAVRSIDPELAVLNAMSMDAVVERSLGQRPFAMQLLAAFAALALVLASVGIYSVIAYTVRQRDREIGIRMALGAPAATVLRMVVVEGLRPTLAGVGLGVVLAAALAGVIRSQLYGVSAHDPGTFGLVAALVIAVGVAAALVPAFRATRVDPVTTLRGD